jgi:hypothetical protein
MSEKPINSVENVEDLLFKSGCILDGISTAQDKLLELKNKPYSVGRRLPGTEESFISVLDDTYAEIEKEIFDYQSFIQSTLNRRLSSFNETETVANFLLQGMSYLVRGARLLDVLNLKYHYTTSKSKINDEVYEMLRIYFTSDSGKRVRSLSKNMGNIRTKNDVIGSKILTMLGYTHVELNKNYKQKVDFTARFGYEIFEIDVRSLDRTSLIETYTFVYLWQFYKKVR